MADVPKKLTVTLVEGQKLEVVQYGLASEHAPTVVMLHEGLGSVSAWRDWPAELAQEIGVAVLAYSRAGYGNSDPASLPRSVNYLHHEADDVLPTVLTLAKVEKCILVGHSDGASIALLHAGGASSHPSVRGLALLSPHVFFEPESGSGIRASREAYLHGDLRGRLSKHHRDVDHAFWGWNDIWLNPEFSKWNIEDRLSKIGLPILLIQEDHDPYGTLAQLDAIQYGVSGPTERLIFVGNGHFPQKDFPEETTRAVTRFARRCLT